MTDGEGEGEGEGDVTMTYSRILLGPRAYPSPPIAPITALITWGDVSKLLGLESIRHTDLRFSRL